MAKRKKSRNGKGSSKDKSPDQMSKTELLVEVGKLTEQLNSVKRSKWKRSATHLLGEMIKWGGLVLISLFAYLAVSSLAGKETNASFLGKLEAGGFSVKDFIYISCIALLAVWALGERGIRLRFVEKSSKRIRRLEADIDPGRTSSGLTDKGETNPRERP